MALALLVACVPTDRNCVECTTAIDVRNATAQPLEVVLREARFETPPMRVEPGTLLLHNTTIPSRGDLTRLFVTIIASDAAGAKVFCRNVSWKEFTSGPAIDIVLGEISC